MFQHCIQLKKFKSLNRINICSLLIIGPSYQLIRQMQAVLNLPHCVRSSLETVPAEQEVQEAAPVCSDIEISGHFVQIVTVLSLYVPALHSTEKVQKFEPHKYL